VREREGEFEKEKERERESSPHVKKKLTKTFYDLRESSIPVE